MLANKQQVVRDIGSTQTLHLAKVFELPKDFFAKKILYNNRLAPI